LLPPYYKNYGKRIVKNPKVYFYDTGLVAYLTGIESLQTLQKGPLAGSLFENYIISEIMKKEIHQDTHAELFYFRSSNGLEIDLIIDRKKSRELIEIKNCETFRPKILATIATIFETNDSGNLLYCGKDLPYSKTIKVSNYKNYFEKLLEKQH
jgi:uncharacterized protein